MANNVKVFLELIADSSRWTAGMKQGANAISGFARKAKTEIASIRNAFGSLKSKLASMGLSIGAGALLWQSARLDKSLTQIGQTAGATGREVQTLRKDLFRLGSESGQSVDSLKEGFNVLVQSGLSMKESKATLEGVNTAMAVTGADAKTLAGGLTVAATAFQFDLAKPGQALDLLDKMTVAGRLGNAELENLADIFARVGVNAASAGMNFNSTLAFVEGLSQIERNPERLATLADSTLRVFTNLNYMAGAQRATGVQFFDAKGQRRDAMAVLEDIRKKYKTLTTDKQQAAFVQAAFGKTDLDTIKGLRTLLTGGSLDKVRQYFREIGQAGGTLKRDMAEATSNLVDQAGRLKSALREAADGFAAPIKNVLTDLIKWSMDSREKGGLDLTGKDMIVGGVTAVAGTALIARYGGKLLEMIFGKGKKLPGSPLDILKGKAGLAASIAEGKAIQAATGVTPVFVTNWPAGGSNPLMPSSPDALKKAEDLFKKPSAGTGLSILERLKGLGGKALTAGSMLATGTGALTVGTVGAGIAGMGTGLYALIDALRGGSGKNWISEGWGQIQGGFYGEELFDWIHGMEKPEVKVVNNITVDKAGRVNVDTDSMNSQTNLKRGKF